MQEDYSDYKLKEGIKESIKDSIHYPTNYSPSVIYSNGKFINDTRKESRVLSRRGRDDRPQEESSKNKVKVISKRRKIRKNLSDII